jgi:hypothetical protein
MIDFGIILKKVNYILKFEVFKFHDILKLFEFLLKFKTKIKKLCKKNYLQNLIPSKSFSSIQFFIQKRSFLNQTAKNLQDIQAINDGLDVTQSVHKSLPLIVSKHK